MLFQDDPAGLRACVVPELEYLLQHPPDCGLSDLGPPLDPALPVIASPELEKVFKYKVRGWGVVSWLMRVAIPAHMQAGSTRNFQAVLTCVGVTGHRQTLRRPQRLPQSLTFSVLGTC